MGETRFWQKSFKEKRYNFTEIIASYDDAHLTKW
jgi:hypothetical protein